MSADRVDPASNGARTGVPAGAGRDWTPDGLPPRCPGGQVAAAWSLATPGERPTRVIVLGLAGLAVGVAQLGGDGLATAALDLGYLLALAVLAGLEGVGCVQLLVAVRHTGSRLG